MHQCECAGCLAQTENEHYCDMCNSAGFDGTLIVVTTKEEPICSGHIKRCGA